MTNLFSPEQKLKLKKKKKEKKGKKMRETLQKRI